jgi:hypothetical protein
VGPDGCGNISEIRGPRSDICSKYAKIHLRCARNLRLLDN